MRHLYIKTLCVIALSALVVPAYSITRSSLSSYASSLNGLKKAELKKAVYKLCQPTTILDYGSGTSSTWGGFWSTDRNPNQNNLCVNRYSDDKFYFTSKGKSISGMNIEHSMPKSWWGGDKNNAYKDLYNLYPSPSSVNSAKSNYAMSTVTKVTTNDGYTKIGTGKVNGSTESCFEPCDQYKGDFCRGYMYMATIYQNFTWVKVGLQTLECDEWPTLRTWAQTLYLQWTRADKVDSLEVARNNAVNKIQGNRNLFIDYPFLAEYIWGDSTDVAFNPYTSITTASDDDRYLSIDPSKGSDDSDEGELYFVKTNSVTSGKRYLIIAENKDSLLALTPLGSTKTYGYPTRTIVKAVNDTVTLSSDYLAHTFKASGAGYQIIDSEGRYYWHDGTYRTLSVSSKASTSYVYKVTAQTNGTFKIVYASDSYLMQYRTGFTSFGQYSSSQSDGIYPCLYEEVKKSTTGIEQHMMPTVVTDDANIYDLSGRCVGTSTENLQRGLYIRGGKKFIIR